jgi:hypothetical protein
LPIEQQKVTSNTPNLLNLERESYLFTDLSVAKLPDPVITNIFTLQRRLIECIDATTATEFRLFQQFGENAETSPELEELQSIRERLLTPYSRIHALLLRVAESQPTAPSDVLNLLYRTTETGQACLDASIASLQDIQRNWN